MWGPTGIAGEFTSSLTEGQGQPNILFTYDLMGNRVGRHPISSGSNALTDSQTIYDGYGLAIADAENTDFDSTFQPLDSGQTDPIGYKGQVGCFTDPESGLVYCQQRYYSPLLGRWLTRDPSGLERGVNEYEFAGITP